MLSKNNRNLLLMGVVISIPLIMILIINWWPYTTECFLSSIENKIQCEAVKLCKNRYPPSSCYDDVWYSISENVELALAENNSNHCKEIKEPLRFICYYKFAKRLEFTLDETFMYNLEGQDFNLCAGLSEAPRKKCFFNLALENHNLGYCNETEQLKSKCEEAISFISEDISQEELLLIFKQRISNDGEKLAVYLPYLREVEGYRIAGERGTLEIYNNGSVPLDGKKLNLYKNLRLVDVDGCRENEVIRPLKLVDIGEDSVCRLDFTTPAAGWVLEVTYGEKTIFADSGCNATDCWKQYH